MVTARGAVLLPPYPRLTIPGWNPRCANCSASARAAELARLRFEGGVADFLAVLDAERTQLDAEDQLAQAHTDAATSYAALYKALGGERPAGGPSTP